VGGGGGKNVGSEKKKPLIRIKQRDQWPERGGKKKFRQQEGKALALSKKKRKIVHVNVKKKRKKTHNYTEWGRGEKAENAKTNARRGGRVFVLPKLACMEGS